MKVIQMIAGPAKSLGEGESLANSQFYQHPQLSCFLKFSPYRTDLAK